MNSCILMADVVEAPQLRYTSDTQTPIAEMWVEIPGLRDGEPPARLKVVGWGNLAQDIQERYHEGDRVIVEGRLGMNTVDRQEGFKEKRAELTAQRIHLLGAGATLSTAEAAPTATTPAPASPAPSSPAPGSTPRAKNTNKPATAPPPEPAKTPAYSAAPSTDPVDYDEIPF